MILDVAVVWRIPTELITTACDDELGTAAENPLSDSVQPYTKLQVLAMLQSAICLESLPSALIIDCT